MGKNNTDMKENKKLSKKQIIKILKLCSERDLILTVKNNNNNEVGVASYTKDREVAVFEGADDGSDDKVYSIDYFIKNYTLIKDSINFQKIEKIKDIEELER